jgi:glutamate--cysteine ligase
MHCKRRPANRASARACRFDVSLHSLPYGGDQRDIGLSDLLHQRLALLVKGDVPWRGLRGVERESLRVDAVGLLARTGHPVALGSALTHPNITTDYAESLLELISAPHAEVAEMVAELDRIHRFVQQALGEESMWAHSMPATLPEEAEIPIAWYGTSHIGMLKHVYRRGLALRYGKAMQCIAGIHYNFSLPEALWEALRQREAAQSSARDFQSEGYIALIRNFQRRSWLLMYLLGASPALEAGFLQGRAHQLQPLGQDTLALPYATSLRMSDLGYQNKAQAGLIPPYNTLDEYMSGMARAVQKPWPEFEAIGLKQEGEWVQISTNVLQIENEYYATVRPKRVTRPLQALCERGVQYVEVRCIDVDPFEPVGIGAQTAHFLDVFLTTCALADSPRVDEQRLQEYRANFASVVREGRRPGLRLLRDGTELALQDWARELLQEMRPVAQWMDASGGHAHSDAVEMQLARLSDVGSLPSSRVLEGVREAGSFHRFALERSLAHRADFLGRPLSAAEMTAMRNQAQESLDEQARMEASDRGSFDEFIEAYRAATPRQLCCDQVGPVSPP